MICRAKTTKGKQCTRKAINSDYCWQHVAENSNITQSFPISDDVLLNSILPLLDIKTLVSFSQISKKLQKLCDNTAFWNNRFKSLPFSYEIPKTLPKIMKEYRRI